jgi:hypothetical protein
MLAAAVEASRPYAGWAVFTKVLAGTVAATWCLLARPCQVSEMLAPEASLSLDLTAFHAADLSLANKETVVEDVFSSLCRVKPDAKQCEFP